MRRERMAVTPRDFIWSMSDFELGKEPKKMFVLGNLVMWKSLMKLPSHFWTWPLTILTWD